MAFQVGDEISIREDVWENGTIARSRPNVATIVVTRIDRFGSFSEMLENLGYEHFRPDDKNLKQAVETYRRYYDPADERRHGVVGISFRLK